MPTLFYEQIIISGSEEFIGSSCEVYADAEGRFFTVETDPYEGCAMFTLPVAVEVHRALGEAIQRAQAKRSGK